MECKSTTSWFRKITSFVSSRKILGIYSIISTLSIILLLLFFKYLVINYKGCPSYDERFYHLQPTLTATPKQEPTVAMPKCITEEGVIFSSDEKHTFAACLENGQYQVYKKTDYDNYKSLGEKLTRLEDGNILYLSYTLYEYYTPNKIDSQVFKIDKLNKTLENIINPLDVPNPKLFVRDNHIESTPVFWLFEDRPKWVFSTDKTYMLLMLTDCEGCSTTSYLYAYNFKDNKLIYVGVPYPNYSEETYHIEGYFIEWLDGNTLKWKEGETRSTNDYVKPFETIDLDYKITDL